MDKMMVEKISKIRESLKVFENTMFWDETWVSCMDYVTTDVEEERGPFNPDRQYKHCSFAEIERYRDGKWRDAFEDIIEDVNSVLQSIYDGNPRLSVVGGSNDASTNDIRDRLQTVRDNLDDILENSDEDGYSDENEVLLEEAIECISSVYSDVRLFH